MKKIIAAAVILAAVLSGCSGGGSSAPADGGKGVAVSFDFLKKDGYSTNQIAVWVEDGDGNYIKTLYVTKFTAEGGWKVREQSLPLWVKSSDAENAGEDELSAVSSATPASGKVEIFWDLKDAAGNLVQGNSYVIKIEATVRAENAVLYTINTDVSEGTADADIGCTYTGEAAEDRDMISNVTAEFRK